MRRRCLCVLALLVLLAATACNAQPTATPTSEPTPRPVFTEVPTATSTPEATPTNTPEPTPTRNPNINPLTGEEVSDPEVLRHRPILIRYGHDRIARPPSGLSSADVVFEEAAEGGFITRITGVFLDTLPEVAGPVRSARPAVIDMVWQLNGVLVYAGASGGTQWLLVNQQPCPLYWHVGHGADLFFRSGSKPSPHNLYVRPAQVRQRMIEEGVDIPQELRGWPFSTEVPAGTPATRIHVPHPWMAVADYTYDEASGTYLRFVERVPHTDALTGKQLAPSNVIVLYAEYKVSDIVEDTLGNTAFFVTLIGEGRVQVFRDGVMIEGTWHRDGQDQMFTFLDKDGKEIPLKPGQTWIDILPLDARAEVQ